MISNMVHQKIIKNQSDSFTITPPSDRVIIYLGIQATPGITFSLNGETKNSENLLMIGATGVFELDLRNTDAYITSITFDGDILTSLNGPKGEIIVDYISQQAIIDNIVEESGANY